MWWCLVRVIEPLARECVCMRMRARSHSWTTYHPQRPVGRHDEWLLSNRAASWSPSSCLQRVISCACARFHLCGGTETPCSPLLMLSWRCCVPQSRTVRHHHTHSHTYTHTGTHIYKRVQSRRGFMRSGGICCWHYYFIPTIYFHETIGAILYLLYLYSNFILCDDYKNAFPQLFVKK